MKPEHRSALLALASRRGHKGFSDVVGEALESYLRGEADREKRRRAFRALAGVGCMLQVVDIWRFTRSQNLRLRSI